MLSKKRNKNCTESQNHRSWQRPRRPSSPACDQSPPWHQLRNWAHTPLLPGHLQGWTLHISLGSPSQRLTTLPVQKFLLNSIPRRTLIQLKSFKLIFKPMHGQKDIFHCYFMIPNSLLLFSIMQQNSVSSPWTNTWLAANLSSLSELLFAGIFSSHIKMHPLRKTNYLGCGLSLAEHLCGNNAIAPDPLPHSGH